MKRKLLYIFAASLLAAAIWSCGGSDDSKTSFDESLLSGYWVSGTEYWYYASDRTGHWWDTSIDMTEDEAKPFTWSLTGSDFRRLREMEIGPGKVPEYFTMTKLTASQLQYKDDYDSFSFTKTSRP